MCGGSPWPSTPVHDRYIRVFFGVLNKKMNLPNYLHLPELVLSPLQNAPHCLSVSTRDINKITHLRETVLPSFSLPSWNASSTVFMDADDERIGGCGWIKARGAGSMGSAALNAVSIIHMLSGDYGRLCGTSRVHRHRNTLPRLYCLLLPLYTHQVQPQIFHLITAFVSISVAAFFAYSDTLSLTQYGL